MVFKNRKLAWAIIVAVIVVILYIYIARVNISDKSQLVRNKQIKTNNTSVVNLINKTRNQNTKFYSRYQLYL